jgi:hypothetical protein
LGKCQNGSWESWDSVKKAALHEFHAAVTWGGANWNHASVNQYLDLDFMFSITQAKT